MNPQRAATRREFLQGQPALERLQERAANATAPVAMPADGSPVGEPVRAGGGGAAEAFLVHLGRRAMACQFELYFNGRQYPNDVEAGLAALDEIDRLEDQLSVYREHSEVSQLNRRASFGPVEVEPGLFDLLVQAMEIFAETGGAYDITSSPLSRAWGFFRRAGVKPSAEELTAARARVGGQFVRLDRERRTVAFLRPEMELSLNSIGKGYSLDRARRVLEEAGVHDFLFHGGQSSVLAAGSQATLATGGWSVGLRHPLRPERRLAEFCLRDEALGTSGSATQFFHYQGKRYGHVLDPRSGQPADGVYSATVIAATAAEADALSTAFYVLGSEAALDYCRSRPNLAMAIVTPGPHAGTIQLTTCGLEESRWRLLEDAVVCGE